MTAIVFNDTVGLGTILAFVGIVCAILVLYVKAAQADPSEWRENYLAEVTRREEVQAEAARQRELKHTALNELAALKARTDLQPLIVAITGIANDQKSFATQLATVTETQQETVRVLAIVAEKLDHHLD